jgi:hypothetical protein
VNITASETAQDINVVVGGAASAAGNALGGSFAINFITNTVDAHIAASGGVGLGGTPSMVTASGPLSVVATDTASIATLAGNIGASLGGSFAGAAAVAVNNIHDTDTATIDDSTASSGGAMLVSATFAPPTTLPAGLDVQVAAMSVSGAGAGTGAFAGSLSLNWIDNTVEAKVSNIAAQEHILAGGKLSVLASDAATIDSLAGAVAIAGIGASGSSVAVGASVSFNYLGGDPSNPASTDHNVVRAAIESDTGSIQASQIVVSATYTGQINNITVAGSAAISPGALALAIGGAVSINIIHNTSDAHISGSPAITTTATGADSLDDTAEDTSTIRALAGGVGIAITTGAVGIAVGVSLAVNDIGNTIVAYVDSSHVTSAGTVNLTAMSTPTIEALTIGVAAAVALSSGGGVAGSGAGSGSGDTVQNTVRAYINNSGVSTASGAITATATDSPLIQTIAGALGIGVAVGGSLGVGASVGISVAVNDIQDTVQAYINNSTVSAGGGDVTLNATEGATIDAFTIGGAVGAGVTASGAGGIGIGAAGAGSGNTVSNNVDADIQGNSTVTTQNGGDVIVMATDESSIEAIAGGLGIGLGVGGIVGAGLSLGVAAANNHIANTVKAYVDGSKVTSAGAVDLIASENASIFTVTFGGAIAAGVGTSGGSGGLLGVGLGVAVAGSDSTSTIKDNVDAYVADGNTVAALGGSLAIDATDSSSSTAGGGGIAAAFGVGAGLVAGGLAVAAGFAVATNAIQNSVLAYVDDSTARAQRNNVTLVALEKATIKAVTVGGAVAVAVGAGISAAVAIAVGVGDSTNTVHNTVEAYLANGAQVTTATSGDVTLTATDSPNLTATTVAASVSTSGGVITGAATASAAIADNDVADTVETYSSNSTIASAGQISLSATMPAAAMIQATCVAAGVAISIGVGAGFAGAGASSTNTVDNTIQSYIQGTSASAPNTITATGGISLTAAENATIKSQIVTAVASAALVGGSLGISLAQNTVDSSITAYVDNAKVTSSAGQIAIGASSSDAVNTLSVATSVALTLGGAGAGASATANVSPSVSAYAGSGAALSASGNISVTAGATDSATAATYGVALSVGIAGGVSITTASANGSTTAHIDGVVTGCTNLMVQATAADSSDAEATALAGGGIAGFSGAAGTATTSPTVNAYVGSYVPNSGHQITATGSISVGATSTGQATGNALGIAISGLFSLGASVANATESPQTTAGIGSNANLQAGQDITVTALNNITTGGAPLPDGSDAKAIAGAGSLIIGAAGAGATSTASPEVDAGVASGASLTAGNNINIVSQSHDHSGTVATGVGVGFAGIGYTTSKATDRENTSAHADSNVDLTAGNNVSVTANGVDDASAKSVAAAGGVVGAGANNESAMIDPTIGATTGSGGQLTAERTIVVGGILRTVPGTITIAASLTPQATANFTNTVAAGVAVGVSSANAYCGVNPITPYTPNLTATVGGNGTTITAGALNVTATAAPPAGTQSASATGDSSGIGLGTGFGAKITATAALQVDSFIGSGATVNVAGPVTVSAAGTNTAVADSPDNINIGIGVSIAAISVTATASGTDNAYLDAGATVGTPAQPDGSLSVTATGTDQSTAIVDLGGGGIFAGHGATATATTDPTINAYLGNLASGSSVDMTGDISVLATSNIGGAALTKGASGGIVNVGESDATVNLTPTMNSYIGPNSTVVAGGKITVESVHGTQPAPVSDGTFTQSQISNNEITFTLPDGLVTGNIVTYAQNGNPGIGALSDGRVYQVIAVPGSNNTLKLGSSFDAAKVNTVDDTIVFTSDHDLETGDLVIYENNGGRSIGGLTPGQLYKVLVIDAKTIKLQDPTARNGTYHTSSFNPFTTVDTDLKNHPNSIHLSGFKNGEAVTYNAPAAVEAAGSQVTNKNEIDLSIDASGNKISKPVPDNFSNGDAVIYTVAPGGHQIGGLTPGSTYFVITDGSEKFKVSLNKNPLKAITLDGSVADGAQIFTEADWQPIGGLNSGQTYYVVNDSNNYFQLANAPAGKPLTLTVSKMTEGNHTIGVEGLVFNSAGTGTQDLAFPLTAKNPTEKGKYQLIGVGGAAGLLPSQKALLAAAPGGGQANASAISSGGGLVQVGGANATVNDNPNISAWVGSAAQVTASGDITIVSKSYVNTAADGTDSGGGFVGVGEAKANITTTNLNYALVGDGAVIATQGNFVLRSQSFENVNGSSDSNGGGFVKIGKSTTTANVSYQTFTIVGQGAQVTAASQLTVESQSNTTGTGNSTANGSGFGVGSHASDYLYLGSPNDDSSVAFTQTTIFPDATLTGQNTTVDAVTAYNTAANSTSVASAFAANTSSTSIANANETSNVSIDSGATIAGSNSVEIDAENNNNSDIANAGSHCNTVFGSATSNTTANVFGPSQYYGAMTVTPDSKGVLTLSSNGPTINKVSGTKNTLQSLFGTSSPKIQTTPYGSTIGGSKPAVLTIDGSDDTLTLTLTMTPHTSSIPFTITLTHGPYTPATLASMLQQDINQAITAFFKASPQQYLSDMSDLSEVDGAAGATIVTPNLLVEALATFAAVQENDNSGGGFIVGHYNNYNGSTRANRTIHWNSNVVTPSPQEGTVLYVDANGKVEPSSNITPTITPTQIIVPNIGGATGGGTITFVANVLDTSVFSKQETNTSNLGLLDGNQATFSFQNTASAIRLINASTKDLVVQNIETAGSLTANQNKPNVNIYVQEDGATPILDIPLGDVSPFEFNTGYSSGTTLVDIENTSPLGNPNIMLEGSIDNPIGTTIIRNQRGSILSTGSQAVVTTNILDVSAPLGSIGSTANPFNADLVQSESTTHVKRPIQATVLAGGNAYLNFAGLLRDPDFVHSPTNPFVVPLSSIQAGGNIVGTLQECVQDTSGPAAGFGIAVFERYGVGLLAPLTTFVTTHFRPGQGNGQGASSDPGFFTGGVALMDSTYSFGNLTAGANIELTGMPVTTIVSGHSFTPVITIEGNTNLNPHPSATGQLDASTNGSIRLTETKGAMRVGQISSTAGIVALTVQDNDPSGDDLLLFSGSSISAEDAATMLVADNVTIPVGSTVTAHSNVLIEGDFGKPVLNYQAGSIISISGQIFAPTATIDGGLYNNDVISLTNVTSGTDTTVNTGGGLITVVNVGSIPPPTPNGGVLGKIQGPLKIVGGVRLHTTGGVGLYGQVTLNVDDTGSAVSQTGTLTSSTLTGLGMAATGIAYSGVAYLNINLGTAPDQFNVRSNDIGTTSTIVTQATGNTWNVGSLAPLTSGGVLSGVKGLVAIDGGGSHTALTDTLNFDDSGSTAASETGNLTDSTLTGLGMGIRGVNFANQTVLNMVTFVGQAVLNINLGNNGTILHGNITNDLPATTTITGGSSVSDSFISNWANDFNGTLNLSHLGDSDLNVSNEFYGHLNASSPAHIESLVVGGSVNVGSSISAQQIDNLNIGVNLDINLTLPGIAGAPAGTNALGTGVIGGSLPKGITLTAASIGSLSVGTNQSLPAGSNNLAGIVDVTVGNLGTLIVGSAGSITTTAQVNVAGNLNTLTMQGATPNVGQVMAGVIDVFGTLGTATIAGGTPGLFIAGHVGTIGAYGGFGPVVLRVIEAGVQRWLEEDPTGQVFSQANAAGTATTPGNPNYINTQYFYESAGFSSPQISARITNGVSTAPDQFDLSTVVFQDGASFNLVRLDASGVSGIGNVAVEGALVTTLSAAAGRFFLLAGGSPDPSPAGVYLPSDDLASVSVRDYAPKGSIVAAEIQGVAFGSFTNSSGQVEPGSQATSTDAASLLAPGTAIVQSGSVSGQGKETFRVPFAALPGQQLAFFLDTAKVGGVFDPNNMVFTLESDGDGIHAPVVFPATRGAVTGLIGVDEVSPVLPGSGVRTVDLYGDGGSIYSGQFIARSITSTGPLGDLTDLSPLGLSNVTAPSIFGSIAASGPIFGTIQTTGVRTDPVTGAVTEVNADLGRVFVVPAGGRNLEPYVTATTVGGELPGSLAFTGKIISRGNLISQVRSDGGATGLVAAQGNFGAISSLLPTPTRVGGLLVNGGFGGQLVVLGNDYGDLTLNGGLGLTVNGVVTPGRIAIKGTGGAQSGILGNVVIDRGFYSYGGITAGSAIVSGGEIGDASLGTTLSVQDTMSGIVAAVGSINPDQLGTTTPPPAYYESNDTLDAAVIDAIFSQGVSPSSPVDLFDESTLLDLANLNQIVLNLNSLKVVTVNNQKMLAL